jgi:hypothetical protein
MARSAAPVVSRADVELCRVVTAVDYSRAPGSPTGVGATVGSGVADATA